ncbi:MAG: hypothetical protein WAP47_02785 [Candidatus Rokuibacteriota bacterium]
MTQDRKRRPVPLTGLRRHYHRLEERSTQERLQECNRLAANVKLLVNRFLKALDKMKSYHNRGEPFFPETGRVKEPVKRGTVDVTRLLKEAGSVVVRETPPYSFQYVEREVNPLRTTRGDFVDGTRSAAGGIDYVGLLQGELPTPILGEIKVGSDKDAYYAFVQLLTYLSELSSTAQFTRANRFLFKGRLVYPVRFDLHILLWDYNDKGKDKRQIIESTRRLAEAFKTKLTDAGGASCTLRRVLCLRNPPGTFGGELDLVWSA